MPGCMTLHALQFALDRKFLEIRIKTEQQVYIFG
jgi:hypothetical protein